MASIVVGTKLRVMNEDAAAYRAAGWARLAERVSTSLLLAVSDELDRAQRAGASAHGMRDVLSRCPAVVELAGTLSVAAAALSGFPLRLIRGLLLAKPSMANWTVPWHQDLAIALAARREAAGFVTWSIKQGVVHVEAPEPWASGRIALRVHLDACGAGSGPLRVLPGSHRHGVLDPTALAATIADSAAQTLLAELGEVLAVHPLVVHASSPARVPGRRVLHLEYVDAAVPLPEGLAWSW